MNIHPSAVISPNASLGAEVKVGPFCVVGPDVVLGDGCELLSHVVIEGRTSIGAGTRIFPFASIGHEPQDLKFKGENNALRIGERCVIREHVTMNPGTEGGGGLTSVGDACVFLAGSHVAHDCHVGDHVIFSNNVMLAGHCRVEDFVIIGGGAGIHQHVRIGAHAFVGGLSGVENDVIPYGMALGNRAHLAGLNIVGLKRRGFDREAIHDVRRAYRLLFANEGTLQERLEDVEASYGQQPLIAEMVAFIRAGGERSLCTPRDAVSMETAR